MKICVREERCKRGTRDGKQTNNKAQMTTLRLFVKVNFALQTTRW
jgi:hypothetical protein